MRSILTLILSTVMVFGFLGCEGDQGPAGPAGSNPPSPPIITAVVAAPDSVGSGEHTTLFVSAYDPNGDEMTYSWTATAGTFSATDLAAVVWTAPQDLGLYEISVTVTDEDGSVDDGTVVGVNVYVPTLFPSYLGNNGVECQHCHAAKAEGWMQTNHANAYNTLVDSDMADNPYCLQCHTTGFDDEFDFAGNLLAEGEDRGGYDENPAIALRGVQCEACHDPTGPNDANHMGSITDALTGERCGQCHHQNEEYETSGHGMVIENLGGYEEFLGEHFVSSGSCQGCHTSEGYMVLHDADWAALGVPEDPYQVTCATCHDVHMASDSLNPHYLRGFEAFTTSYGGEEFQDGITVSGWGAGQVCGQCHHARRDRDQVMGQIEEGSSHPGPHHSAQSDMVLGYGSYEIEGYTYDRTPNHSTSIFSNMCVDCHMHTIPRGEEGGPLYGHSFAPDVRKCQECHSSATDLNVGNVQTEIEELMAELHALLPQDENGELLDYGPEFWTLEEREAGYAYFFIEGDGSRGVHNQDYTKSLLENAIDYLSSGIVDNGDRAHR